MTRPLIEMIKLVDYVSAFNSRGGWRERICLCASVHPRSLLYSHMLPLKEVLLHRKPVFGSKEESPMEPMYQCFSDQKSHVVCRLLSRVFKRLLCASEQNTRTRKEKQSRNAVEHLSKPQYRIQTRRFIGKGPISHKSKCG